MKKFFVLTVVAVIVMTACSNQESIESAPTIPTAKNAQSNIRSYEEALKIAENAIGILDNSKLATRSVEKRRKIDLSENKVFMRDANTRVDSSGIDSLIYVFNFENNEGFALVSASRNTEGLLAVTEKGHCDPGIPSGIGGFDMFVDMAKKYVLRGILSSGTPEEIKDSIIEITSQSFVGPYISVKWGQQYAEGELCINQRAGCANTAMAQIMTYYSYPDTIHLTYNNGEVVYLNWTNIKAHNTMHYSNNCSDYNTHISISKLLRELGERNYSVYVESSPYNNWTPYTDTITESVAGNTFRGLNYTVDSIGSINYSSVYNGLDNGHLALVSGLELAENGGYGDGHTWVEDGYMIENCIAHEMINTGTSGWQFTGFTYPTVRYYNHFNWGWYGFNDGYYSEGVCHPGVAYQFDGSHAPVTDYSYVVTAFIIYH